MLKLNYENYLKDKDFDFEDKYYERFKFKEKKFEKLKEDYPYSIIFYKVSFKDLVFFDLNLLKKIEKKINNPFYDKKRVEKIFNYEDSQYKKITPFFTNNFTFRTCFYCNKDFITNFQKEKSKYVSTFQLDHFYDKGTYPYLALSFYNLIPSCPTCNSSKVKGSENTIDCISPNNEDFMFDEKVKFKLYLNKYCKNLHVKDKDDIDIKLKEKFSNEYGKYVEIFKLNERYKEHKDIVFEMIEKAELYPESRLKELQDLTGIPYQQIKKDIFNLIDEKEDLSKKPFSKLIKDISEELDLI